VLRPGSWPGEKPRKTWHWQCMEHHHKCVLRVAVVTRWCRIDEHEVCDLALHCPSEILKVVLVSQHAYCNVPLPHARLTVQSAGFLGTLHSCPSGFAGLTIGEESHLGPDATCRLFPNQIFQILPCVAFRQLA
jgi:hypothetical protein